MSALIRTTCLLAALMALAGCPGRMVNTAGNVAGTAIKTTGAVVGGAVKVLTFADREGPR
ncbi:MAG: hypothetical protein AAGF78_13385 [Pseudomonadota bacterium]